MSPDILFASANASAHFALHCLEPASGGALRATSSFVDPAGKAMLWHDFGPLEGPGWATNAAGGAHLLYRWGGYVSDVGIQEQALRLVDHVLDDGFVQPDGLILPYWHTIDRRFCLNYTHNDDWLCPGSLAKIGVQMLELARDLPERRTILTQTAHRLAGWLADHIPLLDSGWTPRRIAREGAAYPLSPHGSPDPIFEHSADGLFLLQLWALTGNLNLARTLGDAFVQAGGLWGSINHDTFDDHENVAYACAFRILRQVAGLLERPGWRDFAYEAALPAMQRFRMTENHNGVFTQGLFWMEESWDTAYLWENAEVAQAHLEAWLERGNESHRDVALGVLAAIARHHYGARGFLTEGVDWNNHVGQQHHIRDAEYGAIRYTEPLLNNLHHLEATLTYLNTIGYTPPPGLDFAASIHTVCTLPGAHCMADNPSPDRVQLFDTWAQRYDASLASTGGDFPFDGYERILDEVVTLAGVRPGMRILDLGIGTGNLAQRFVQQGCEVWGIDFSAEMLAKARVKLPQVHLVRANLLAEWPATLPGPFDRIVSAYVLHEFTLEAKVDVLRRAAHYLVPEGVILVADIAFPSVAIRGAAMQQVYGDLWDEDEWYWAADETVAACESAGLCARYRQMSRCGGIFIFT